MIKSLRKINYNKIKNSNCFVDSKAKISDLSSKEKSKAIFMMGNYVNKLSQNTAMKQSQLQKILVDKIEEIDEAVHEQYTREEVSQMLKELHTKI